MWQTAERKAKKKERKRIERIGKETKGILRSKAVYKRIQYRN